jgi:hypothetical protein
LSGLSGLAGASIPGPLPLMTNRDGIAGPWQPPASPPPVLVAENVNNLPLWDIAPRAALFDMELFSRLGFEAAGGQIKISHLANSSGSLTHVPLVSMTRPGSDVFAKQLEFMRNYEDLRADRAPEIMGQLGVPLAFFASIVYLDSARTPRTVELVFAALRLAYSVVMRAKHALACRRPHEFAPQVQPIIPTPNHGTLPSGHATEGTMFAVILGRLLASRTNPVLKDPATFRQFLLTAERIATNRTVAGVHFPVDSVAGTLLGAKLAEYFIARCTGGSVVPCGFDGTKYDGALDYRIGDVVDTTGDAKDVAMGKVKATTPHITTGSAFAVDKSDMLSWLWNKAEEEWN